MAAATLQNFMMSLTDGNRGDDMDYISNRNVDESDWTPIFFARQFKKWQGQSPSALHCNREAVAERRECGNLRLKSSFRKSARVIKSGPLSIPKESAAPISILQLPSPGGRGRSIYNELRPLGERKSGLPSQILCDCCVELSCLYAAGILRHRKGWKPLCAIRQWPVFNWSIPLVIVAVDKRNQ